MSEQPALALDLWSRFVDPSATPANVHEQSYEAHVARESYETFLNTGETPIQDSVFELDRELVSFRSHQGKEHTFRRSTPMSRIAKKLFRARLDSPHQFVAETELLQVGWPGERFVRGSERNRLWVTLSRLRSLGLEDALQKGADGYRFSPEVNVRVRE